MFLSLSNYEVEFLKYVSFFHYILYVNTYINTSVKDKALYKLTVATFKLVLMVAVH